MVGGAGDIAAQFAGDDLEHFFPGFTGFDLVVDAFFDKDFLEAGEMPFFEQFMLADFQFAAQQFAGLEGTFFQDFLYGQKVGFLVNDDAGVGGDGNFTIGERVKGVHRYIGGDAGG